MKLTHKLFSILIFCIAMAYLESAVVVYLRELYYPEGFSFPLKLIPDKILVIELGRELATLIMLLSIAMVSGKLFVERISFFFLAFGVWDIFYYVWLKIFINWPASVLTDDLLFLIPIPWISPVLAPILVSLIFILSSLLALKRTEAGYKIKIDKMSALLTSTGFAVILFSFTWKFEKRLNSAPPVEFMWEVFIAGLVLLTAGFFKNFFHKRIK